MSIMRGADEIYDDAANRRELAEYLGRNLYNSKNGRAWADDPYTAPSWDVLTADEREWWIAAAMDTLAQPEEEK